MVIRRILPYAVAIASVGLSALMRAILPWMGDRAPLGLFAVAVLLSAWLGGLLPGLFATALSLAAGSLLFMTHQAWGAQEIGILSIFTLNGCLISGVCETLRQSRAKAEMSRDEIEKGQSQLKESEQRFRQLADSAPVLIWITDEAGQCTWFNLPWLEFTGRAMEQETGIGWIEGVHPDDRERCLKTYAENFEARKPFEMDYRLRRNDQTFRWIMGRGIPLFEGAGRFVGYIGSCVDIQLRKEAEEGKEASLRIEQSARREAERAALLKDEFLATVSHEMRTPLTAMLGWVRLLRSGSLPPDAMPQALETIERNARAQAKLIDDLLDMSRILSGRLRLDLQPINPLEAVQAAVSAVEPAAAAKQIGLAFAPGSPSGLFSAVTGDSIRLQQIIWNLLSNAVKFTPAGGKVTVEVSQVGGFLEISVSDTGEGITADFLPHVFDRFRQQDASTMRRHQGLGLGLSIVKHLTELHGGTVRAESPGPGKGARFVVSLPVIDEIAGWPGADIPGRSGRTAPSLLGTKILVVDDDTDTRELLRSILAQNGASVRTAASAPEAIRQFEARCPDVLVSDIGMPGQDGYDLIRSIRARETQAGGATPALALTAFARSDDRRRAIDAGFHMHLSKPVEPSELVTVVARLVRR